MRDLAGPEILRRIGKKKAGIIPGLSPIQSIFFRSLNTWPIRLAGRMFEIGSTFLITKFTK